MTDSSTSTSKRQSQCFPSDSRSVFDPAKIRLSLGCDEQLLCEIIDLFLAEHASHLAKLKQAIMARDYGVTQRIAHILSGELSCFGMTFASQYARELEDLGRNQDLEGASVQFAELECEIKATVAQMLLFKGHK